MSIYGPPSFVEITENVRLHRRGVTAFRSEEADVCQCRPEGNVGCMEACLNRSLFTECISGTCPCGEACQNQRLQKRQWAKISYCYFGEKGWGVVAEEPLTAGMLVVEYIGEVCDLAEAERRARRYEKLGLKNTYIMNLNPHEVIDATNVGNYSRFINHSCKPNAECQKWTVGGDLRVAIIASKAIAVGDEITYNYNLDWNGGRKVKCQCGADNCSGFLGAESILWRKTAQSASDAPLNGCVMSNESDDLSAGLLFGGNKVDDFQETTSRRIRNRFHLSYPSKIVTRSKIIEHSNYVVSPPQKRRRFVSETEADCPEDLQTSSAPTVTTPRKECMKNKLKAEVRSTTPPRPQIQYRLVVAYPLPKKFTVEDPPAFMDREEGLHTSLLSITDVVPLPELICDPFLMCNQAYYLAIGDIHLNGMDI